MYLSAKFGLCLKQRDDWVSRLWRSIADFWRQLPNIVPDAESQIRNIFLWFGISVVWWVVAMVSVALIASNLPPSKNSDSDIATHAYDEKFNQYLSGTMTNNPASFHHLGWMYYWGKGVRQNLPQAFELISCSAKMGYVDAQVLAGEMCYWGIGTPVDLGKAAKWFKQAADGKNANGQHWMSILHAYGEGVRRDLDLSWDYREKARKNSLSTSDWTDELVELGIGIPSKDPDYTTWLRQAALQGLPEAAFGYAKYQYLIFGRMNVAESYFLKALEAGFKPAVYRLGDFYRCRDRRPETVVKGVELIKRAAAQGDPDAIFYLAYTDLESLSDTATRMNYLPKLIDLAENGHDGAQNYVAQLYFDWFGNNQNLIEAYAWYAVVRGRLALQSIGNATIALEKMTGLQRKKAINLAAQRMEIIRANKLKRLLNERN